MSPKNALNIPVLVRQALSAVVLSLSVSSAFAQGPAWQSNVEGWSISGDAKLGGCRGEASFQDGMRFRIALIGPEKRIVFAFGKATWTDVRPNTAYKIRVVFDGQKTWTADTVGAQMAGIPALMIDSVKDAFFSDFMNFYNLSLFHNDRPLGSFSLRGTSAALTEIKKCHDFVSAPANVTPPLSTSDGVTGDTLSCMGPLARGSDIRSLEAAYGAVNVESRAKSTWPEYLEVPSAIYGKEPGRRIEVFWRDQKALRKPASIRLGEGSRWKVATAVPNVAISLESSIEELERINGRPFSLSAFAPIDGGLATPASWRGGQLAQAAGGCAVYMYFRPSTSAVVTDLAEVSGKGDLMSNSSVLRRTHPILTRLELFWPPDVGEERLQRLEKLLD